MALRPLKLLYTGVWATGYVKKKSTFLRVKMKDINLSVYADDTFALKVLDVASEGLTLSAFSISGRAQILYTSSGDVDEILISDLYHNGAVLDKRQIFSINKNKCARLPIPEGEAFFCFSSRLPPAVDFSCYETVSDAVDADYSYEDPTPASSIDEMDFDDVFGNFENDDFYRIR